MESKDRGSDRLVWVVCSHLREVTGLDVPPCFALPGTAHEVPGRPGVYAATVCYKRDCRWTHMDGVRLLGVMIDGSNFKAMWEGGE